MDAIRLAASYRMRESARDTPAKALRLNTI